MCRLGIIHICASQCARAACMIVIPPTLSIQFRRSTKYGRVGSLHMVLVVWRICVGNGTVSEELGKRCHGQLHAGSKSSPTPSVCC
eukprot:6198093-Pleurochrysis_carterae.AAC.2